MSTAMDIFLNAADSLPFPLYPDPDVLDIAIKSDMESLIGGHNDFSGFNFNSLESEEFADTHEIKWFNSNSNHSILDFSGDDGPTMVNPNAVMPIMSLNSSIGRSPSPAVLKESHLTFSPATIKITSLKSDALVVKKDLLNRLEGIESVVKKPAAGPPMNLPPVVKSVTKIAPILAKPSLKPIAIKATQASPTIIIKNAIKQVSTPIIAQVRSVPTILTHRKTVTVHQKSNSVDLENFRAYPKPAYSYSCLIAMALKNSKSGSLPVSEIYNFMCKHFPYFKTAPNGWKNSVRHNLSLNKCFEKIEKHALNGAQRKGCLWAMNPAKINKMDEEVQKWSRKDPNAIKKAMVNPETLEALERGEMKFSCSYDDEEGENYGDSCGSAAESDSDVDVQEETEETKLDFSQIHFVGIKSDDYGDYEEIKTDQTYDDLEEDKELLRVEMELAKKELDFERTINNKRRRTHIVLDN